jgi:hypothetical protein
MRSIIFAFFRFLLNALILIFLNSEYLLRFPLFAIDITINYFLLFGFFLMNLVERVHINHVDPVKRYDNGYAGNENQKPKIIKVIFSDS